MPKKNGHVNIQMTNGFQPWLAAARENKVEKASDRSLKPALLGIWIDPKGYLVASDGFVLAVVPCKITGAPRSFPGALVPADFVKAAAAKKRHNWPAWWPLLKLDLVANTAIREVPNGERAVVDLITGTFPNWRQLIPARKQLGKQRNTVYDPGLLVKVTGAIAGNNPTVFFSKDTGPAVVVGQEEKAFGLIMPVLNNPTRESKLRFALKLRQAMPKPKPVEEAAEVTRTASK